MRILRTTFILMLTLILAMAVSAETRRRAVGTPSEPADNGVDALAVGKVSGATVSGTVASVAGSVITLNTGGAAQVRIDASAARIVGMKEVALTIASVTPGARITAFINTATAPAAGAALAAQVVVVESGPDLLVNGTIEAVDVAAGKFTVLGIPIYTDAQTAFASAMPTFAPIRSVADLAVGQVVSTEIAISGTKLIARRVTVAAPVIESLNLRGKVKTIGATSWVITDKDGKDITVAVNDKTKISGNPVVGDEVQIVATRDSSAAYLALVIVKLEPVLESIKVQGKVKSIAATAWVITGTDGRDITVTVNDKTKITGSPVVGDEVVALGSRDAAGAFVALAIMKAEPIVSREVELPGYVKAISTASWTIGGPPGSLSPDFTVKITTKTEIYADPKVGDKVVVIGTRDSSGVITASKIRKG